MIKGLDTNQPITKWVDQLYAKGYRFAARYYRRKAKWTSNLRRPEVDAIHGAGMAIMPVFQHKSNKVYLFTPEAAKIDGRAAVARATENQQPTNTAIYVAFDTDFSRANVHKAVEYGKIWSDIVKGAGYGVGAYGDREVLDTLAETSGDFGDVIDHKWATNAIGWKRTQDWDVLQSSLPFQVLPGLSIDNNVAHDLDRAGAWHPPK